jgi:hypothetical protein
MTTNIDFDSLNPEAKRVRIAQDVIAQLDAKKLVAKNLVFLKVNVSPAEAKSDEELRDILRRKEKCTVCALGAVFVAAVDAHDQLKAREVVFHDTFDAFDPNSAVLCEDTIFPYLERFFTKEQLGLIEIAFERGSGFYYPGELPCGAGAEEFAQEIDDPETRMRLIMQNIIENGGEFKP